MPMGGEVEHLYAARAADLSEDAQRLLLLAAIADTDEVQLVLDAAAALDLSVDHLEEAELSGLISVGRGVIRFKHPLVRSAIHQRSTFRERQAGHQAMAALLTDEADDDRRAWHLVRAATGFDDELADLLEASAARALARGGPASAVERWQWSAELTSQGTGRCHRLDPGRSVRPDRRATGARATLPLHGGAVGDRPVRDGPRAGVCAATSRCDTETPRPPTTSCWPRRPSWPTMPRRRRWRRWSWPARRPPSSAIPVGRRTSASSPSSCERSAPGPDAASMIDLLVGLGKLFAGRLVGGLEDPDGRPRGLRSPSRSTTTPCAPDGRPCTSAASTMRAPSTHGPPSMPATAPARDSSPRCSTASSYIELLLGRLSEAEAHALEGLRLAGDLGWTAGSRSPRCRPCTPTEAPRPSAEATPPEAHELATRRRLRMVDAGGQWGDRSARAGCRQTDRRAGRTALGRLVDRGTPRHPALGDPRPGRGSGARSGTGPVSPRSRAAGGVGGRERAADPERGPLPVSWPAGHGRGGGGAPAPGPAARRAGHAAARTSAHPAAPG